MNFSFYTKKIFPILLAIFGLGNMALSQNAIEVERHTVLKNGSFQFSFLHFYTSAPPEIEVDGNIGDGFFDPSSGSQGNKGVAGFNKLNNFHYTPDPGFIGRDTVIFEYYRKVGTWPEKTYKVLLITVVPSFLRANDDFASTIEGQPVEIAVLPNDIGNGTNQVIADITNINNGTAVKSSNDTKVLFTPASGFKGIANLNYSICDAQGSCSFAVVNICVNAANPAAHETLSITTNKNKPYPVMLDMNASFSIATGPAHGILDTLQTLVYIPNQNYVGTDQVVFQNASGHTRTVNIRVVNVPKVSDVVINDVVYTPRNQVVDEIHLLDNDNGGQFFSSANALGTPFTQAGGTLTYLPSVGNGVYSYAPPAGFVGIDKFKYRVAVSSNPTVFDTATCYIVVNDLNPVLPVYEIRTPKNTPLVLGDHLPFEGYSYEAISTPAKGSVQFLAGQQTYTSQHGQVFTGKNMLVYDPNTNATGADEFEFEYCADGIPGGCQLVKVELELVDIVSPQSPTLCAGRECIWAGDTNKDGTVDVRDVLPIGLCMGDIGAARTNATTEWYGQAADNWNSLVADGLGYDVKYLDTDGNGIISSADTTAIGQNYGSYHNLTPAPVAAFENMPFYIEEPNFPENPEIGDVFYAPIGLGTSSIPAINAYGLAFELLYDPSIFEVNILFQDNSWMDYNSPILSKTHKPLAGKIDAAYTRTSGLSASGFGYIGVAEFIVIDDVSGSGRPNKLSTQVTLNGLGLMTGTGTVAGLPSSSIEIALGGSGKAVKAVTEDQLVVFPNPASQAVTLHINGQGNEMEQVQVYSMTGSLVYDSGKMTAKRMMLNVADFAPGMYMVRVLANGEVLNKKVEVIR